MSEKTMEPQERDLIERLRAILRSNRQKSWLRNNEYDTIQEAMRELSQAREQIAERDRKLDAATEDYLRILHQKQRAEQQLAEAQKKLEMYKNDPRRYPRMSEDYPKD